AISTKRAYIGEAPITKAGIPALAPVIEPTKTCVNGNSNTIKMINGMERKILTNTQTITFKILTDNLSLPEVSYNSTTNNNTKIATIAIDTTVIHIVSQVALHLSGQLTFLNRRYDCIP